MYGLTSHTLLLYQLYGVRSDIIADNPDYDEHASEHLCVTGFLDFISRGHDQNFALAAFQSAVEAIPTNIPYSYDPSDLSIVLDQVQFVQVAQVLIPGEKEREDGGPSRLRSLVSTVLYAIDNDGFTLVYRTGFRKELHYHLEDEQSAVGSTVTDVSNTNMSHDDDRLATIEADSLITDVSMEEPGSYESAPFFVRFLLDGNPATLDTLSGVSRSSTLSAQISIPAENASQDYSVDPERLPLSYADVASELQSLLDAYVAEETLERLRHYGPSISDSESNLARTVIRKARYGTASTVDVFFYNAKSDAMIAASAPIGAHASSEGFTVLFEQLLSNQYVALMPFGDGGGLKAIEVSSDGSILLYFCFVRLRRSRGLVTVEVYHPDGPDESQSVLDKMHEVISGCCHRTNQILLLRSLFRTRTASDLLIPVDDVDEGKLPAQNDGSKSETFRSGVFRCSPVFRTTFDLFHRCAMKPSQVARSLEATVLHIFAISNRRRVFVYKEEDGGVFYMNLASFGGGLEPTGKVELLVYGVRQPGVSVTEQLRNLLQKRIQLIAVDMLSSVLTKNPRYTWKQADIDFMDTFSVDSTVGVNATHQVHTYMVPANSIVDPGMLLVYFRQNICGSTFFHPLLLSEGVTLDSSDGFETSQGLRFYYNNATSALDPKYQAFSTLTKKGKEYARQAGKGLAIVEVSLVNVNGERVSERPVSPSYRQGASSGLSGDGSPLTMIEYVDGTEGIDRDVVCVQIKVTEAALKRAVLHNWTKLILDQAFASSSIENILTKFDNRKLTAQGPAQSSFRRNTEIHVTEYLSPSASSLSTVLAAAHVLPHPAVLRFQSTGVMQSTLMSKCTVQLLEDAILEPLGLDASKCQNQLSIVRTSRNDSRQVAFSRILGVRGISVVDATSGDVLNDSPIASPEYTVFYRLCGQGEHLPKLFEKVAIDDTTSPANVVNMLSALKDESPASFQRSFAFILTVRRNSRVLWAYNWSEALFSSVSTRIQEKEQSLISSVSKQIGYLMRRSLKMMAPLVSDGENRSVIQSKKSGKSDDKNLATTQGTHETSSSSSLSRLLNRPVSIRLPKLVGKSVDGAAAKAVAMSRTRARSNTFGQQTRRPVPSLPRRSNKDPKSGDDAISARPRNTLSSRGKPPPTPTASPSDKQVVIFRNQIRQIVDENTPAHYRRHTSAMREHVAAHWPRRKVDYIPLQMAAALLQEAGLSWSSICETMPFPDKLVDSHLVSFAEKITTWTPSLSIARTTPNQEFVLIVGPRRSVRGCKCMSVARLSSIKLGARQMVAIEVFVLTFPRYKKGRRLSRADRRRGKFYTSSQLEKDCCGSDFLALSIQQKLLLDRSLFDHAASVAERSLKSVSGDLMYGEALVLVQLLLLRYTLREQRIVLQSNYQCFKARIVLKSYEDDYISKYDSPTLYGWLTSNISGRNMIACGNNGLCFKREVLVSGTHSICFLVLDERSPESLNLVLLSRTQGRDLHGFIFREGSNLATAIIDCIAIECAKMAYKELRVAARRISRDSSWEHISTSHPRTPPSPKQVDDLLKLCVVRNAVEYLKGPNDMQRFELLCQCVSATEGSWNRLCKMMLHEPAFAPAWTLDDSQCLYYCSSSDTYLLLSTRDAESMNIGIVEREEVTACNSAFAVQKLLNYLLYALSSDVSRI